jgi:transposase
MEIAFHRRNEESYRQIARKTGCDPRTVKKYCENPELIGRPRKSAPRPSKLDPFRDQIAQYLEDDIEYQASAIYDKLCRQGFTGSYTVVKRAVRPIRQQKQLKAFIRFETEPGAQAQVDFGEFQVVESDGTVKKYFLFALILGFSRLLYAELLERCDMVSFLEAHQRAFRALGGVPHEILYDRMRNVFLRQLTGKTTADGQATWKVEFTQSLVELALHYGFTPRVAPAYAAWVKGKIERPMDFVRESFWRGYAFTDLTTANRDLTAWLGEKAERVHGTTHKRVDEQFEREKPYLLALPTNVCDVSERLFREVRKDCTIAVLGNRYVVEHTLVGRKVLVRVRDCGASDRQLRVFEDNRLVVTYEIPEGKGHLVQDPKFYAALLADREMQARKFARSVQGGKHRKPKGRAWKKTISPNKPANPVDVSSIHVEQIDIKVEFGIDVAHRSLADYANLGGEVSSYGIHGGEVCFA